MQANETLHLLIGCGAQAQLESCIALFRNAGRAVRAHRVSSLRDLGDMLRDQQWDLVVFDENHPEVKPDEVLALLRERKSDIPCILRCAAPQTDGSRQFLASGASDVIPLNDEHLLFPALREIAAVRARRELQELRVKYEEIAQRAELLLSTAQDAIAYVVDGMHVHANAMYAEMFGYPDVDELASVPVVDLIAADRQQEFKEALRRYRDNPEQQTAVDFTGLRADGSEFPGKLTLSTASFEGESCMQVMVRAGAAVAPSAVAAAVGPGGVEALAAAIRSSSGGHLLLIGVSGFAQHCRNLGISKASRLIDDLGSYVREVTGWKNAPIRVGDSSLAVVLADADGEALLKTAQNLVEKVSEHIHSLGEQSVTCNIYVVVDPLNGDAPNAESLLDRGFDALLKLAERAERLRGADSARAELLRTAVAVAAKPLEGDPVADAINNGEFRVLFQPMVSLRGDSNEYYEVCVIHEASKQSARQWLREQELAAASVELDHWSITQACEKLATHLGKHPQTRLVINIGAGSLTDADFANWLAVSLRAAELPPDAIVIQFSHLDASPHLRESKQLTEQLRGLGCQISMSEVHSANNPIADINHLKPHFARIDDELAAALKDSDSTNTLLKPLIDALHQEQLASIMPNVQSASVMALLWQLGVNFMQGNYLQAPAENMTYEFADLA